MANAASAGLTLAQAAVIVDAAIAAARTAGLAPLTVVVLDAGGHVIACKREDDSGILRFEVACGKAYASLGMGHPSRNFEVLAATRPAFVAALPAVAEGRFVPAAGGVLVLDGNGRIIGAAGVSGDTSDADEACAIAGIHAAGLRSDPTTVPVLP